MKEIIFVLVEKGKQDGEVFGTIRPLKYTGIYQASWPISSVAVDNLQCDTLDAAKRAIKRHCNRYPRGRGKTQWISKTV